MEALLPSRVAGIVPLVLPAFALALGGCMRSTPSAVPTTLCGVIDELAYG